MNTSMLSGQVALITGGSRGIGRAIAVLFAREGAHVYVNYRNREDSALEVVREIESAGDKASAIQGDVRVESDVERIFDDIRNHHSGLDILVNNAGILKNSFFTQTSAADFDHIYSSNARGTFLCTRAALKLMYRARKGKIINMASIAAGGNAGQAAYAASKAAVVALTKSAAREAGPFGITVNALAPGFIETDMTEHVASSANQRADLLGSIALRRLGLPNDIARAALFLASPLSDYVSGQVLGVDGCQTL